MNDTTAAKIVVHTTCGQRFESITECLEHEATCGDEVAKFEAILDLEVEVQGHRASVAFAPNNLPDYLWAARREAVKVSQAKLFSAVDALTLAECIAFAQYRKNAK